jgi:transposase
VPRLQFFVSPYGDGVRLEILKFAPFSLEVIKSLDGQISKIEKTAKARAKLRSEYELLKTVWGVGPILGLTIMYETGEISRFSQVGDYCSYARCVGSARISNGKKKGENNTKNGNRYLSWAVGRDTNIDRYEHAGNTISSRQRRLSRPRTISSDEISSLPQQA